MWTRFRGHGPPTQVLFGENVCENERIGSHGGGGGRAPENFVCRSANVMSVKVVKSFTVHLIDLCSVFHTFRLYRL